MHQRLDGGTGVTHELFVGDAASLSSRRGGVIGVDVESLPCVEVGADRVVPAGREPPSDLLGPESHPGR